VGAAILKLDRDRKLLNADVTSTYPVDLKSVQPMQKGVNKCEQRIIPEHNAIVLLQLGHEWHTTISFWARKKPYKRKMIQNGSDINAQEKL